MKNHNKEFIQQLMEIARTVGVVNKQSAKSYLKRYYEAIKVKQIRHDYSKLSNEEFKQFLSLRIKAEVLK